SSIIYLALSNDGKGLYATATLSGHHFWTTQPLRGKVLVIDPLAWQLRQAHTIDADPHDVLALNRGLLLISGGSNQSAPVTVFDAKQGKVLFHWPSMVYMRSNLV